MHEQLMYCPTFPPIHCKVLTKYDRQFISYAKIYIVDPTLISSTCEVNHSRNMMDQVMYVTDNVGRDNSVV
jgi:hypothetical protein